MEYTGDININTCSLWNNNHSSLPVWRKRCSQPSPPHHPPYRPSPATQCTATQQPGSSRNLVLSSFSQSSTISVGGGPPSSKGQSCVGKREREAFRVQGSINVKIVRLEQTTYQNLDPLLLHRGLVIGGVADSHQRVNVEFLQLLTNQ